MIPEKIHESFSTAWESHPIAAISGIVALIGALVSIWPAITWISGHFQTAEDARQMELRLHRETAALRVDAARQSQFAARNRVNDCNIRRTSKDVVMSTLEQNACAQYDDDYRNATARLDDAIRAASTAYRDK